MHANHARYRRRCPACRQGTGGARRPYRRKSTFRSCTPGPRKPTEGAQKTISSSERSPGTGVTRGDRHLGSHTEIERSGRRVVRSILDVNVIIALLDPDHAFHEQAHEWWAANEKSGWASCPITENGVVRIMSNPSYSGKTRFAPKDLIAQFQTFVRGTNHEFWP